MSKELLKIPGVGDATRIELEKLGIEKIKDLKGKDPEELYLRECMSKGMHVDRCELYVFRCAVHYANDPENSKDIKWWHFKD